MAHVNMYVNLPHRFKGTHMSRFIEILNRFHGEIDLNSFRSILEEMKKRLQAEAAHIEISFPYFLRKNSDSTLLQACRYECQMHGSLENTDELELQFICPDIIAGEPAAACRSVTAALSVIGEMRL